MTNSPDFTHPYANEQQAFTPFRTQNYELVLQWTGCECVEASVRTRGLRWVRELIRIGHIDNPDGL